MKPDNVNHPSHYADHCSIECFDAMKAILGYEGIVYFCFGNMFKYLWRHKFKNGVEDIKKATWYSAKAMECVSEIENTDLKTASRLSDIGCTLMDILEKADKEYPPEEDKEEKDEEDNILDAGLDEMLEKIADTYDVDLVCVKNGDLCDAFRYIYGNKEEKNDAKDESPSKAEETLSAIYNTLCDYIKSGGDVIMLRHEIKNILCEYYSAADDPLHDIYTVVNDSNRNSCEVIYTISSICNKYYEKRSGSDS